jgi:DNA polymerase I-like protein with 3'-5' exonuclease and polymerase domains/uracil-DNA glycosylase
VRPSGPCPARIMIIGEAPGEQEILKDEPFVGYSGVELNKMLHDAGIMRSECFVTNVCHERPLGNDIGHFMAMRKKDITANHRMVRQRWVTPEIVRGLERLAMEVRMCDPHVIIALGNLPLWALTGQWGVTNWRGSLLETDEAFGLAGIKVIPTIHPASIMRQWGQRPFVISDLRRVRKESAVRELVKPEFKFTIRPKYHQVIDYLENLFHKIRRAPTDLSVDIETRAGHTACIGLATSSTEAICIPLMCTEDWKGYWSLEEETVIQMRLYEILTHPNCHVIGQNFSYDMQYFDRHHFYTPNLRWDTMLAQHTMFSNQEKGLDVLSSLHCEHHVYWKGEGKTWDASIPEEVLWHYNCEDAVRTFEIAQSQRSAINAMGLAEVNQFQQDLIWPVVESMNRGLRVDHQRKAAIVSELKVKIAERQRDLEYILGHQINLGSPAQLKVFFYDQCQVKPVLNRKTKQPSTDDESLRVIASREPLLAPVCRLISEYRSLSVFCSNFAEARVDIDDRMRSSYNIGGTETFRFSSSKNAFGAGLNLQNVPQGDEESELGLPNIRSLFIPDEGMEFFDIDLDSADLRIVQRESGCAWLGAQLAAGRKPYIEVAKEYYQDDSITKAHPGYQLFKSFCHGTHYLGEPKGLAGRLALSVTQATKIQQWYFGLCPEIKEWHEWLKNEVATKRVISNVLGYRIHAFDRVDDSTYREMAAWIPQSTVACLINRVYVNLYNHAKQVQVLLQVHDSLAGQYPIAQAEENKAVILSQAQIVLPYKEPLIIPVGIKTSTKSWGDCK